MRVLLFLCCDETHFKSLATTQPYIWDSHLYPWTRLPSHSACVCYGSFNSEITLLWNFLPWVNKNSHFPTIECVSVHHSCIVGARSGLQEPQCRFFCDERCLICWDGDKRSPTVKWKIVYEGQKVWKSFYHANFDIAFHLMSVWTLSEIASYSCGWASMYNTCG